MWGDVMEMTIFNVLFFLFHFSPALVLGQVDVFVSGKVVGN
jgi:hypothetical protein